jgi:two-component sensor histidine kinase
MADHQEPIGLVDAALRQQATIAEFGGEALQAEDLDALLTRACALAAQGLGVAHAKVLERQPIGGRLLVRAGVGWAQDVVGRATLGEDLNSQPGFALQTGWPVVSEDLSKETRFRVPDLLVQHGIRSAVNVIIRGQDGPFGVLEADDRVPRKFTVHDINFLQSFANLLAAAIERLRAQDALRTLAEAKARAARQNEALLRELHHRVNNNLQQIGGLLRLQKDQATPEGRQVIETIEGRLTAMRLLYRTLRLERTGMEIAVNTYLHELVQNIQALSGAWSVRFEIEVPDQFVPVDVAVPLGLITNEFITNSLKHAFPDGRGTIKVRLDLSEPHAARLVLADTGIGMPSKAGSRGGLGLTLIALLAEQLGGTAEWNHGSGGTRLTCRFAL